MQVDVWSDVVCPWCFVGLANLAEALERFEHGDEVEVVLHSFQLEPDAPARDDTPLDTLLSRKYGLSAEQVRANQQQLVALGAERGIDFRFDDAIRANTFDAHRLLHHAAAHGLAHELKQRLGRAYFTEGQLISDDAVLRRLAEEVALDGDEAAAILDSDLHAEDVRSDLATARQIGVTGVPFFVVDRRLGVSGARPAEVLVGVLEQAWAERSPGIVTVAGGDDAAACGPDGCEVPG